MKSIIKAIAVLASTVALFVASMSSGLCFFLITLDEPKMPESLLLKQK